MRLLAYCSVPLSVPCVFWKSEVRERLGQKLEVGELRSLASYGTATTAFNRGERIKVLPCPAFYLLTVRSACLQVIPCVAQKQWGNSRE